MLRRENMSLLLSRASINYTTNCSCLLGKRIHIYLMDDVKLLIGFQMLHQLVIELLILWTNMSECLSLVFKCNQRRSLRFENPLVQNQTQLCPLHDRCMTITLSHLVRGSIFLNSNLVLL